MGSFLPHFCPNPQQSLASLFKFLEATVKSSELESSLDVPAKQNQKICHVAFSLFDFLIQSDRPMSLPFKFKKLKIFLLLTRMEKDAD